MGDSYMTGNGQDAGFGEGGVVGGHDRSIRAGSSFAIKQARKYGRVQRCEMSCIPLSEIPRAMTWGHGGGPVELGTPADSAAAHSPTPSPLYVNELERSVCKP